jgi:hypothetical protein
MPNRPPKGWMDRCTAEVMAHGGAIDVGAVCAAVWKRKSPAERRAIVELEEGMRSGHHSGHLHGAALKAHEKKLARERREQRGKPGRKGGAPLHGAALAAHERKLAQAERHHEHRAAPVKGIATVERTLRKAEHELHRLAKHPQPHKAKHHSCAACGHDRRFHSAKVGCAHTDGHRFCSCSGYVSRH